MLDFQEDNVNQSLRGVHKKITLEHGVCYAESTIKVWALIVIKAGSTIIIGLSVQRKGRTQAQENN